MTDSVPTPLLAALRHWGPRWHDDIVAGRDAMFEAYAPLHQARNAAQLVVQTDLPYGPDARQVFDVYAPPGADRLPVMIFVHGGAFFRGDKDQTPAVYSNVAREFATHGWLALNVEYRLAPQAPWPEGANDVRDAVLSAASRVADWGGDARRLFLFGHSAACAHCATAAWDARVMPANGLPIAGLILASPRVRADVRPDNPNASGVRAYYGADESVYPDREPLSHVRADAPPTFVALAQYENPLLDFYALELAHRLAGVCDAGGGPMPRVVQYPDHNHVSLMAQFDTPHNAFGADVRDWCERVKRGEFRRRHAAGTPK